MFLVLTLLSNRKNRFSLFIAKVNDVGGMLKTSRITFLLCFDTLNRAFSALLELKSILSDVWLSREQSSVP